MIIYDGIIENLQSTGGVSVVFGEIIKRIEKEPGLSFDYISVDKKSNIVPNCRIVDSRLFERYLDVNVNFDYSVFHSTYYRLPKIREKPIVTTVHDFTYEKFVKGPAQWVHSIQKNRAIRNSDVIICVSDNTANDLLRFCPIEESKIRVVHNGVSDRYHYLGSDLTTNEVLFVGARGGYKNFHLAIQAVKQHPNLTLSVVGGGPFSKIELNQLNSHLEGRYQWLGRLSDNKLNEAYNRAYALIYPSSYEGFGIPVIEAMRAGCPVIATNSSSIPEVAGSAGILVDNIQASSFIEALSSVENNRSCLRSRGLEQSNKFSWDKCYSETLKVYNELI